MKKLFFLAAISVMAASCKAGDEPVTAPVEPAKPIILDGTRGAEKLAADNAFAFDLFCSVLQNADDKENAFISPLSLTMALGMLYNGTSPEAGAEMAEALGVADFSPEEINAYYKTMREALLAADPLTVLAIANSIWAREGFDVKPTFYELNRTYYDAEVNTRDFNSPETVDEINGWCADNTNDKITEIIDGISSDVMMYLINAVYFKGQWMFEFDEKETRDEDFTLAGGERKSVKMMNHPEITLPYYRDETLSCIELPYGNGAFGMMVMLPEDGQTVDELIDALDSDLYYTISEGLHETNEMMVKLPRFKQECDFPLNNAVQNLGINRIFGDGSLSGINDDPRLAVSNIKQKTFVEVNEKGTEAAAVTVVEITVTSVPAKPIFFADRPFVYLIREKSTGAILFMGRMDEPKL